MPSNPVNVGAPDEPVTLNSIIASTSLLAVLFHTTTQSKSTWTRG